MHIQIYDTTLRDGTQREGMSLSSVDKMRIARRLDELGVDYIEGGWPGSNPKDVEFFERARDIPWKHAQICAFGTTCRVNGSPQDDPNIQAMLDSGAQICTVVGKTWTLHVTEVLRTSHAENLRIIEESVAYLAAHGGDKEHRRRVFYDAEHFFDGYLADPEYSLETLRAALRGGAEMLVLCDTNGGALPAQIGQAVREVKAALEQRALHPEPDGQSFGEVALGIHAHNDGECAVANSLEAVLAGAVQVQGTINGYGERCGNANLCSVIPNLELKLNLQALPEGGLARLADLSHFVAEVANLSPDEHLPYVGKSAFAHKGGLHVAGMRRSSRSYQHIDPEKVGNAMRVVVSELSGRGNLLSKAEEYGLQNAAMMAGSESMVEILNDIKSLESQGFSFEAAEASIAMMFKRQQTDYVPPFELIDFLVNVEHRQGRGIFAEAMVKVRVNGDKEHRGEVLHTAAEGNGPVNALDTALRKALLPIYPRLGEFHLADYKVRILDGENGTKATTRVLIDTQNGTKRWSTVGASSNIIEASWRALADSVEYGLAIAQPDAVLPSLIPIHPEESV